MIQRLLSCLVLLCVLLGGCATPGKGDQKLLEETLESYAAMIRWGNFEQALSYVDPQTLKDHPVTALDLQRYHQVQVTGYNEQPPHRVGDAEARQLVEIGLVNVNTQAARSIIDNQLWRFDDKAKRWWLVSGLPDITAH
jgi:hypothetical protein